MTESEMKMSETDTVIFPVDLNFNNRRSDSADEKAGEVKIEEQTIRAEIKNRFARLKKSLRKRSVSIL